MIQGLKRAQNGNGVPHLNMCQLNAFRHSPVKWVKDISLEVDTTENVPLFAIATGDPLPAATNINRDSEVI